MLQIKLFLFCIFFVFVSSKEAKPCDEKHCKLPNCQCSTFSPKLESKIPQLVALSFDESNFMEDPFFQDILTKKNPDGCNISATFFVTHEGTNYTTVNYLYNQGHEIASFSVTMNHSTAYWREASAKLIQKEMGNQRTIISKFANISAAKIQGARIPYFDLNGDNTYSGLEDAGFLYDNSWIAYSKHPLYPYTLDYLSKQPCLRGKCPVMSYPGFWTIPVNNWKGMDGKECELQHCMITDIPVIIFNWMMKHFNQSYNGKREPISLLLDKAWFMETPNTVEALDLFLEYIIRLQDVFVVSNEKLLNWMKNPEPVGNFFTCEPDFKPALCNNTICKYKNEDGTFSTMGSCTSCPDEYPSLNNPEGHKNIKRKNKIHFNSSKILNSHSNEIEKVKQKYQSMTTTTTENQPSYLLTNQVY